MTVAAGPKRKPPREMHFVFNRRTGHSYCYFGVVPKVLDPVEIHTRYVLAPSTNTPATKKSGHG